MKRTYLCRSAAALLAALLICPAAAEEDAVMLNMKNMTLREKVGQLFMVRPDALEGRFGPAELEDNSITGTTQVSDEMVEKYAQYPCGGFALFRKNILSAAQLHMLTERLHGLGEWMRENSYTVDGCGATGIPEYPWGVSTGDSSHVYLHILQPSRLPSNGTEAVVVVPFSGKVRSVTCGGQSWSEGTEYTYDQTTGEFASLAGALTIPAATAVQDPATGVWGVEPGTVTVVICGNI